MKKVFAIVLATIMALALVACGSTDAVESKAEKVADTATSAVESTAEKVEETAEEAASAAESAAGKVDDAAENVTTSTDEGITAEKYEGIQTGMSYDEVKALIGSDGESVSESEVAGIKTAVYQWESGVFGTAIVTFENDKVTGKSQAGISESSQVTVTAEQYDKVQTGMTYDEVKKIMGGDGESLSETEIAGQTAEMYTWSGGSLGSNCTISFTNGEVSAKSQFGLE